MCQSNRTLSKRVLDMRKADMADMAGRAEADSAACAAFVTALAR